MNWLSLYFKAKKNPNWEFDNIVDFPFHRICKQMIFSSHFCFCISLKWSTNNCFSIDYTSLQFFFEKLIYVQKIHDLPYFQMQIHFTDYQIHHRHCIRKMHSRLIYRYVKGHFADFGQRVFWGWCLALHISVINYFTMRVCVFDSELLAVPTEAIGRKFSGQSSTSALG